MTPNTFATIPHCDLDGTILGVPLDGLGIGGRFAIGQPIDRMVAETDTAKAREFISAVDNLGANFDWRLAIDAEDGRTIFRFNGIRGDRQILVVIRRLENAAALSRSALEAVSALNIRLVNQHRQLARAAVNEAWPVVSGDQVAPILPRFSARESEVVRLLLHAMSNRIIAQELGVEETAIKARLRTIYGKLGVASRAQAILALTRQGSRQ